MHAHSRPLLSLVLCSRNDGYGGNSLWRLQTALNYLGQQVARLADGGAVERARVEAVVCDWGSPDSGLAEQLSLGPAAAAITRIVEVPPELARDRQKDSPFVEVVANNAAIRRARGRYIGRIDQDTLVGSDFLERFLARAQAEEDSAAEASPDFLFIGRRHVPLQFAKQSFGYPAVEAFVRTFGRVLPKEGAYQLPWFDAPVGVVILHRDLWHACRGYDERLLYWGFMETDLGYRVRMQGQAIDLEGEMGRDFYHLAHAPHSLSVTGRQKNPRCYPRDFSPNSDDWGLADHELPLRSLEAKVQALATRPGDPKGPLRFAPYVGLEWLWEGGLAASRSLRGHLHGDRIEGTRHPGLAYPEAKEWQIDAEEVWK